MKNFYLNLKLSFLMLIMALPISASDFSVDVSGGILNFNITSPTTVSLESTSIASSAEVTIPSVVYNNEVIYEVTAIGNAAFEGSDATKINIPETVTSIEGYAFAYCSELTSISIPKNVTNIGNKAFRRCDNLATIEVDNNNKYYLSENGVLYNKEKTMLIKYPVKKQGNSFSIPNGVTSIEFDAFEDCENLISVTIPNSVIYIKDYAFDSCENLSSITIPNSVTYIGESAFGECLNIKTIDVPNSITYLGDYAFWDCESLTSINIPNNITYIPEGAYGRCPLSEITIPEKVTSIGSEAFAGTSISSITIPDNVTKIDEYVFYDCTNLTHVNIGSGVEEIGSAAFAYCDPLTAINVAEDNKYFTSQNGVLFNKTKTTLIQYPCGKQGGYAIPNTVNTIAESAFEGCKNLTSVTIPKSVNTIEIYAFYECESLASVSIPEGISTIEEMTFLGCTSLKWVNIPSSVNNIKNSAFEKCKSLTSVTIPEGVTTIEDNAFEECSNLKWVKIPMSVSIISQNAFLDCNSLSEIFVLSPIPPTLSYGFDEGMPFYSVNKSIPVYIPIGSISKYKLAEGWNEFTNFIESDFTGIEDSNISTTEIKVIAGNGIDICNYYGKLQVISLAGQVVKDTYVNGSAQITLPKGAYIIVTENKSQKVVL